MNPNDMSTIVRHSSQLTDAERTAFYALLRAGLWGTAPADTAAFPLTAASWLRLYGVAREQTVTGIVYDGLCTLPDDLMPSEGLLVRWVAEVDAIERRNRQTEKALRSFYKALSSNEVRPPLLLKGQSVARLYVNPERRECGDIDLYFSHAADFDRTTALVRRLGLEVENAPDGSVHFDWQGITVELHSHLFAIASPLARRRLMRDEQCQSRCAVEGEGGELRYFMLAEEPNLLQLNAHIMKHVLGRGIGLRQLCDMARAYHSWAQQSADREAASAAVRARYHEARITRWSRLLSAFLVKVLELPAAEQPYADLPSPRVLEKRILDDGNFGITTEGAIPHSSYLRKAHTATAFFRHARFSCSYAPQEAFWNVVLLLAGQLRSHRRR